jgi:hypothetical protein
MPSPSRRTVLATGSALGGTLLAGGLPTPATAASGAVTSGAGPHPASDPWRTVLDDADLVWQRMPKTWHEVRKRHPVGHEVRLGQHNQRLRPRLPGKRQKPLDPTEIELHRQGHGNHREVDVGGQNLTFRPLGRGRPHKGGTTRQVVPYVPGIRVAVAVDGSPVPGTDDPQRIIRRDELGVDPHQPIGSDHIALPTVDPDNPPGHQRPLEVGGEFRGPRVIPAVGRERV